jgi:exopolyphosphatase / guanosine-5'-triphosphate,3'-diphosphate pyrophosphatase
VSSSGSAASCRAVIDLGTNSVKMLVGRVTRNGVEPVLEVNEQTRLGQGLYRDHLLRPEAVEATANAVARFARQARAAGAEGLRVIATSAVREARNADLLIQAVGSAAGIGVEIITGDTEARLAFEGVVAHSDFGSGPLLILDAGGGSTEFILGRGRECLFRQSFRLGAVRMLEGFPHAEPPGPVARPACLDQTDAFLRDEVRPALEQHLRQARPHLLVGTGGAAAILARIHGEMRHFDRERIESTTLDLDRVRELTTRLWESPLEERRRIPGLPTERADIMIMGAIIYEAVMGTFRLPLLRVSTRGLRFAALMEWEPGDVISGEEAGRAPRPS